MDSLRIDTGVKRIAINDDPSRVIEFNPNDLLFAEKFYALVGEFGQKQKEYQKRSAEIEANKEVDENGVPANTGDGLALMREVCTYMRGKIDYLFGEGTSEKAFGDTMSLYVFEQFFTGVTPFIQSARQDKVARYLNERNAGRVMK